MKTYVRSITVGVSAILISLTACHKKDNDTGSLSKQDQYFAEQAAYANLNEADAGSLAASSGSDSAVKAFGQQMATEHTAAYDELKTITDRYNFGDLPSSPDAMHIAMKDSLSMLSGHAFDSAYIAAQVRDHQKAVILFQTEANSGSGDLKSYAAKYLPHIQEHLAKADSIQAGW